MSVRNFSSFSFASTSFSSSLILFHPVFSFSCFTSATSCLDFLQKISINSELQASIKEVPYVESKQSNNSCFGRRLMVVYIWRASLCASIYWINLSRAGVSSDVQGILARFARAVFFVSNSPFSFWYFRLNNTHWGSFSSQICCDC